MIGDYAHHRVLGLSIRMKSGFWKEAAMRIDNLTLKNFRNFENAEIPLNPKMNIVIGNNGSGKSSLLMGALTAASTFFLGIDYASPRSIKTEDVRHVAYETNKIYQQREVYPVEVSCQGVVNGSACTWSRSLSGPKSNTTYGAASDLKKIASELQKEAALPSSQTVLPLIAYYGTGRLWAQKQAKQKEKQKLKSRFEGYQDCIAEQATDKQLMEWFSDMTLLVSQEGPIPQVSAVQRALECCFADLIDHDETQRVKVEYRQRYRAIVVEYVNRNGEHELHPMSEMSDGYRSVLNMVADIAHRMAVLNPQLGDSVLETPGIIIIDEIELHLHPGWQKRILNDLTTVFPNIQFIVSTHSPEVITSYKDANLILLKHEGSATQIDSAYGKDVNTVLRSILLVGDRPIEIEKLFDKFSELLHKEDYAKAEEVLGNLEQILGYDDPSVYEARSSLEIEQMEWPE